MDIRIYIAPQIGSGSLKDPYRSILHNYVDVHKGDWFDEIIDPIAKESMCTLYARQVVHDAIYADRLTNPGRIVYISPLVADDGIKKAKFAGRWDSLSLDFRIAVMEKLEILSIGVKDIEDAVTLKDVLRVIIIKSFEKQRATHNGEIPANWGKIKFAKEDF